MAVAIQLRGGTAAEWTTANPVLLEREVGIETDTYRLKIGDGTSLWSALPYSGNPGQVTGALNFSSITTPSAPASGLDLFSRNVAGRRLLAMQGLSGLDTTLQPAMFGNRVYLLSPTATTIMSFQGGPTHTAVGTVTTPVLDATTFISSIAHAQILSAATANAVAHQRIAQTMVWRGNSTGYGGWFYRLRFGLKGLAATNKAFFGLLGSTAAVAGTVVPSAMANFVGVGWDEGETTFRAWASQSGTGHTRVNTGLAVTQGHLYELTTFAAPFTEEIGWRLDNLTPGSEDSASGTITDTAYMPLASTFLAHHAWLGNGATASAVTLAFQRLYIESDF